MLIPIGLSFAFFCYGAMRQGRSGKLHSGLNMPFRKKCECVRFVCVVRGKTKLKRFDRWCGGCAAFVLSKERLRILDLLRFRCKTFEGFVGIDNDDSLYGRRCQISKISGCNPRLGIARIYRIGRVACLDFIGSDRRMERSGGFRRKEIAHDRLFVGCFLRAVHYPAVEQ